MDTQRVIEALNHALAQELAAVIQLYWHHMTAVGRASPALRQKWREMSVLDMKHAEALAERIDHFGGVPTTQPLEIHTGGDLQEMIRADLDLKNAKVKMYRGYLDITRDDPVTWDLVLGLLREEEEHSDEIKSWLGE